MYRILSGSPPTTGILTLRSTLLLFAVTYGSPKCLEAAYVARLSVNVNAYRASDAIGCTLDLAGFIPSLTHSSIHPVDRRRGDRGTARCAAIVQQGGARVVGVRVCELRAGARHQPIDSVGQGGAGTLNALVLSRHSYSDRPADAGHACEQLLGDAYKRQCLMDMDLEQLIGVWPRSLALSVASCCSCCSGSPKALLAPDTEHADTILINPTVTLEQSDRNTPVTASSYKLNPLGNLVFTRDQVCAPLAPSFSLSLSLSLSSIGAHSTGR